VGRWFDPSSGSQFLSGYVVGRLSGASSLCTFAARVYCIGTAPSEGSEQTGAKQLRRESRVDAIEHPRVLVAHRRRAELVRNAVRAQPGRVGAPQIVRRAARDAGAGAGTLQRLPELRPRQEEAPIVALGVLQREIEQLALPARRSVRFVDLQITIHHARAFAGQRFFVAAEPFFASANACFAISQRLHPIFRPGWTSSTSEYGASSSRRDARCYRAGERPPLDRPRGTA
jgi:hypothetical protein